MKFLKSVLFALLVVSMLLTACAPAAPTTTSPSSGATQPTEVKAAEKATEPPAAAPTNTLPPPPTAAPTRDPNEVVKGGTVIVGTPQEPSTLNPLLSSATIDDVLISFFSEGLVDIDADGKYIPVLAEALPDVSKDGLTITYKLRKGVRFNNGDPFTCADIQFTKDATLSDASGASTSGYKDITSIECPDDTTAVITFKQVYAPYLRLFTSIVPKSAGDPAKMNDWAMNRQPIGTGPWMVKEWQAGDHITMVKNPYYREEGKPYLDSVIIKFLASREVGMQLLGTGEITTLWDLTEADFPTLDKMDGVGYAGALYGSGENELLVFNLADPKVDGPEDASKNPHPILADLKVRQAIQYAIDKKTLVDTLLYGNVRVGTTVLPAGPYSCPETPSEFSPDKAKALLEEAGWKAGADGTRSKNGVKLSLKIATTSGNQLREQTEQVLVEMFKAVGIELVIDNMPSDSLFASWEKNGARKHGQYDILLYTTGPGIDPDSGLFANYHSARIPSKKNDGAGNNFSRYSNPDVDKWIDEAAGLTDVEARHKLYCQVADQINKDIPCVFLYERLVLSGYRKDLQNFRVSPGPADFTVGSQNWWLKK